LPSCKAACSKQKPIVIAA